MTARRATVLGSMFLVVSTSGCALLYSFDDDGGQGARGGSAGTSDITASTGTGVLPRGAPCATGDACESGFCVDGVCCNAACGDGCVGCVAALTDVADGTCSPVRNDTDPHDACAPGGCTTGVCRDGVCAPVQDTTFCGRPSCADGVKTFAPRCMGGICAGQGSAPCVSMMCAPSGELCAEDCMGPDDCEPTEYCNPDGDCLPKLPNGSTCGSNDDCASKACFSRNGSSVCCSDVCSGACESCFSTDTAVPDGTCAPVINGTDPKDLCPANGDPCGTTGACLQGVCAVGLPGAPCGSPASCIGDASHDQDICDGAGACLVGADRPCAPFACDGPNMRCKASCVSNADCDSGAYCALPGNQCQLLQGLGGACSGDSQCESGICAPGASSRVCCTALCNGDCQLCGLDGTCEIASQGASCSFGVCCDNVCVAGVVCGN